MFKNSTVKINAVCNSCEDMACCSSECVLTFLYTGDNIQYVNEQFVSCIHFFLYTSLFIKPHKQKSNGVKSGDLGGQLMTDTMTCENIDSSSCDTLCFYIYIYIYI